MSRSARVARGAASLATLALGAIAAPRPATAQDPVIKPTRTPLVGTRLPAPSVVGARQLPDGRIAAYWHPVEGAAKYQVIRTVPPNAAQVIALPTDTAYLDARVTAGNTYYYVVAAVDGSGLVGLKVGMPPVTATMTSTLTATDSAPPAPVALAAPTAIQLLDTSPPNVSVFWSFTQSGMRYRVERAIWTDTSKAPSVWELRQTTEPRPCCFWSVTDDAPKLPYPQKYQYRVRTVDPAEPTRMSAALLSQRTVPAAISSFSVSSAETFYLGATVVSSRTVSVGARLCSVPSCTVMDTSFVSVDATGNVVAKKPGVTYLVSGTAANVSAAGVPYPRVERIVIVP